MISRPFSYLHRRSLYAALLGAAAAAALGPAPAAAQPSEVSQATQGTEPLALVRIGADFGVMSGAGSIEPVLLPLRTGLDTIEPLADGWIAAGSRFLESGVDLFLLRSGEDGQFEVPPPAGRGDRPRLEPLLVVSGGRLVGLVWLEGRFQPELSVWAAAWDGDGWGAPEELSPPGPGAQLAPAVTVLADGSWLLLWAAVDGHDDEILWSRRRDGEWSAPAPVHADNEVPDISPAVAAVDGGAVAVWSFLDGRHFRLLSARFDGAAWAVGEPFGYDGSHRPRFFARDGRPALLYRTSVPPGWTVLDLDAAGDEVRRSFFGRSHAGQPLLDLRSPAGPRFLLPAPGEPIPATEAVSAWEPRP